MQTKIEIPLEDKIQPIKNEGKPREIYCKPILEDLGDLRTLTLGGSPGIGDSGGGPQFPPV